MKKFGIVMSLFAAVCILQQAMEVHAAEDKIEKGIYIGEMNMSDLTVTEASQILNQYIDSLKSKEITFQITNDEAVSLTAGELGLRWENEDVVNDAAFLGKEGNILERYRTLKDLEYENHYFDIELSFDDALVDEVLLTRCKAFDVEAVEPTMRRENDTFVITEGKTGIKLDVDASKKVIREALQYGWDDETMEKVELVTEVSVPKATKEDLESISDVLGTFTTSFTTSGKSRVQNVTNGARLVNGTVLMPGEEFSFYDTIKPFTVENGYEMAGSYINGQVVDSLGGGICQVSTTLYNAVLLSELDVTMRYNHSMVVSYVGVSADAAIAESSGKDFRFVNSTDTPIFIESYVENKTITMTIYGVETRPSNRTLRYDSVKLSDQYPEVENIYQNAGLPAGTCTVTAPHIGCKAELWKVVLVDGQEVSREKVNSSTYKPSPKSCVVGTATSNTDDYNALMAAIETGSVDQVKAVSDSIAARDAAAALAAQQQQEWQQHLQQQWEESNEE